MLNSPWLCDYCVHTVCSSTMKRYFSGIKSASTETQMTRSKRSLTSCPSRLKILRPLSAPAAAPAHSPAAPSGSLVAAQTPAHGSLALPPSLAPRVHSPDSLSSQNNPNPAAPWRPPQMFPPSPSPPPLLALTLLQLHKHKNKQFNIKRFTPILFILPGLWQVLSSCSASSSKGTTQSFIWSHFVSAWWI